MGNTSSKSPTGEQQAPAPRAAHAPSSTERRVHRRASINALTSGSKTSAADGTVARETVTAQAIPQTQVTAFHQRVQQHHRNVTEAPDRPLERSEPRDVTPSVDGHHHYREGPPMEASTPVQVPTPTPRSASKRGHRPTVATTGHPVKPYYGSSHLQRPPRLPLPIGDASVPPGSPIIPPADYAQSDSLPYEHLDKRVPRSTINVDHTAVEDDEVEDELQSYSMAGVGKAVPTVVEWRQPGERVYVTGTFVNWEKKFRLHKSEHDPGIKSTTLQLRPGTHHLKFIVDGEMRAADHLPTAVDFTNHLVNYIEVSPDDVDRPQRSRRGSDRPPYKAGAYVQHVLPDAMATEQQRRGSLGRESEKGDESDAEVPLGDFRQIIPQALVDTDKDDDKSEEYQRAANLIREAEPPPVLPMFLGRSILNGTTPLKDDNSVLNYPNHTVLNHLATSSIKNGVLATSVTTRYKRKYVTTILYKPTPDFSANDGS